MKGVVTSVAIIALAGVRLLAGRDPKSKRSFKRSSPGVSDLRFQCQLLLMENCVVYPKLGIFSGATHSSLVKILEPWLFVSYQV